MNASKRTPEERAAFRAAAAAAMRRNMTPEEEIIWPWLRDRGVEAQTPLFSPRYNLGVVTDFYHREKRLRIEIDGPQHRKKATAEAREDRKLKTDLEVMTLRFTNQQVREELEWIKTTLSKLLD